MVLAKRFTFFLLGFLIFFLIAFWGFKNNFPGGSLARVAQLYLTKQTGLTFEIKDIELGWGRISTPEISIYASRLDPNKSDNRLLSLEEIESTFSSLLYGKVIITGKIHGGKIKFSMNAFSRNNLEFYIEDLKLEKIPLVNITPYAFVSGNLSFTSKIKNFENIQKQKIWVPEVNINGKIKNTEVIFSDISNFFNFQFPKLNFSEVIFDLKIDNLISIKRIELKGSLEGVIGGVIQLNSNRPKASFIDLNIELEPSLLIMEQIKSFSPMLKPLLCDKTLNVNIKGPINRINFPTRNKC